MTNYYNIIPVITILTPIFVALVISIISNKMLKLKKALAVLATVISLIGLIILINPIFIQGQTISYWMGGWEFIKEVPIGIEIKVDALSLLIGFIISISSVLSSIYSLKYMSKDKGIDKYYSIFLLLVSSMLGFVLTGDLFNMYVMLEIMTFAAISLTAFRKDVYKSIEGAFKYLIIGSIGSSFILIGTALLYQQTASLNIDKISSILWQREFNGVTILSLAMLLVGYAVKSFMVPCHTWPPDAHMAAPSSISMILSGVMSKTGVYGLIRVLFLVFGLLGNSSVAYLILIWGTLTMVVGVVMALIQNDFKRLLAFHSVSQIGYIIVGVGLGLFINNPLSDLSLTGAFYHLINHAAFKCLLFLCAGAVLYRVRTTNLNKLSGLGKKMPFTMVMFFIGAFSISGLPPFNGFISKWLIYQGEMESPIPIVTVIALVVSTLTLASMIKVGHSVFFGPEMNEAKDIKEVPLSMKIPMVILSAICIILGVIPNFVVTKIIYPVIESIKHMHGVEIHFAGIYDPQIIVILVLIVAGLFAILLSVKNRHIGEVVSKEDNRLVEFEVYTDREVQKISEEREYAMRVEENYRNKFFIGGEDYDGEKLMADDLYWGIKKPLKKVFDFLHKSHSGVANDYVLWVVGTLAIILVYLSVTLLL